MIHMMSICEKTSSAKPWLIHAEQMSFERISSFYEKRIETDEN